MMQIFLMIFWSFIIKAIPFKKIFTAVACIVVLISATMIINNNVNLKDPDALIFVKDK